jgi:restriction system protein
MSGASSEVNVARTSVWAEIQRERARRQRLQEKEFQVFRQAQERTQREQVRAEKAAARKAEADLKEAKRLYLEERKAEAEEMSQALQDRVAELDGVLTAGMRTGPLVTFRSLKRQETYAPFDPGPLGELLPSPLWEQFAPDPPGGFRRRAGSARYAREEQEARAAFDDARRQHAAAELRRRERLAEREKAYRAVSAEAISQAREHNEGIDELARDFRSGDSESVARFCTLVLDSTLYPDGFPRQTRAIYRPEPREVVVEWELPPQSIIPVERGYKYVATRDAIDPIARPDREVKERYANLIAQVTLRTIHEVLVSTPASVVDAVTFYGYVCAPDPGTGQPVRPLLLNVTSPRAKFETFVLAALDPIACLKGELTALVSPHPYDLEPVRPLVNFDSLLVHFKFVAGADVIAGLDSRPDLLAMSPFEFETFVKQLFEAMGMKAWKTQDVKDDGVDAVAVSEAPVFGGLCVIQAKRSRYAVGIDVVRALAGTMEDKRATKGVVVTTSWVTKDGHDFAVRHGRIEIMECDHLKYLCKEHLGLDVLISLPKPPPGRR